MDKPSQNITQLLDTLIQRGLEIDPKNQVEFTRFLVDVNYYRVSGYWRYFQEAPHLGDNRFKANITSEHILDVYGFDAGLRIILLEGLAAFEIALRSRFAYYFAQKLDPSVYVSRKIYEELESSSSEDSRPLDNLMTSMTSDLEKSKEPFILRYREKGLNPPIWVAVEAFSMGTVSKMYKLLNNEDIRYQVSKSFAMPDPTVAESIFRSFTLLRNVCAHHGRIWNRVPDYPHVVLNKLKVENDKKIYHRTPWAWVVSLADLVDGINRNTEYSKMLFDYIAEYPEFEDGLKHPHNR